MKFKSNNVLDFVRGKLENVGCGGERAMGKWLCIYLYRIYIHIIIRILMNKW